MKPKKTYYHNSNLLYKFTCPCTSTYIGETSKLLESRVFTHRTDKKSHIHMHIQNCTHFNHSLLTLFGDQPSDSQKRKHLLNHFKIMERNLTNYHARTTFEGMMITLDKPDLKGVIAHSSSDFTHLFKSVYHELYTMYAQTFFIE